MIIFLVLTLTVAGARCHAKQPITVIKRTVLMQIKMMIRVELSTDAAEINLLVFQMFFYYPEVVMSTKLLMGKMQ